MKLLRPTRVRSNDALGRGMDVAITLAVFVAGGWLLDRWLGTTPLFMILFFLVAAVGLFAKLKYTYDAEMERLEHRRSSHSMADRDAA